MSIAAVSMGSWLAVANATARQPQARQAAPGSVEKAVAAAGVTPAADAAQHAAAPEAGDDVARQFLAYMKKSPEERMQEAWLSRHGISKAEFDAMGSEQKQAILAQMKHEFQQQAKQEAEKKTQKTNILA